MNHNQWDSLICILRTVVPDNRKTLGKIGASTVAFFAQASFFEMHKLLFLWSELNRKEITTNELMSNYCRIITAAWSSPGQPS